MSKSSVPSDSNKGQSSSPYISQLVRANFDQVLKNPDNLMRLQSEIMQEFAEKNIELDNLSEEDEQNLQGSLEQMMATIVSKILVQTVTKTYSQFMDMHSTNKGGVEFKTVIEPQNVLEILISKQEKQCNHDPQLKALSAIFIDKISKKFAAAMMMEDDIDMNPTIAYGRMLLLEDGLHYCVQIDKKTSSNASSILSDLIRNDKDILNSLSNVIEKSMSIKAVSADGSLDTMPKAMLKSALKNFLEEMKSNKSFAAELDWKNTEEQIEKGLAKYYVIDDGVETLVSHPKDLYAKLKEKQFSPEASMENLHKKLKLS